ncbi:MAG TPA: SDR family oxidoreductase [Candidatus Binataceae bacterium]|nr:SDR family oxidoreductase [Candidatus Binataceae bacterium]
MAELTRRFEGHSAIVTGAAQGIGKAIAERLAAEGANVMAADVKPSIGRAVEEIASRHGDVRVLPFQGDVSQPAIAELLIGDARRTFGRIEILINNAGGGGVQPYDQFTDEQIAATFSNNLWAAFRCTRAVVPIMREQQYGRIVNVTANAVFGGLTDHAVVNSAKAGVHGLSSGLAIELAPAGITINTVAPAITLIESTAESLGQKEPPARLLRAIARVPMGRAAKMEEVAAAVAFFASREASFISGQVLRVNGGSA